MQPTKSHMAISKLVDLDKVKFVVSQNIDGLHLRSGLARNKLAELHGNMFVERCNTCKRIFVRQSAADSGLSIVLMLCAIPEITFFLPYILAYRPSNFG